MKRTASTSKKRKTKTNIRWWLLPVGIVMGAILIAGGLLGYRLYQQEQVPSELACPGNEENFDCYKQQLARQVMEQSPEFATAALKKAYETNTYVQAQCHQLTHVIGQTAGKRYPDVATAYEHGDDFCASGYYHGIMQTLVAQIGFSKIKSQINTICASVKAKQAYDLDHHNCVHGLGHGIMGVNSNNLPVSLEICDSLKDEWERGSCYSGVFMENVMAYISPETSTKFLKDDDPLYPCNAVENKYKQQCYLMQTSHALTLLNADFDKVFDVCETVPEKTNESICYESLGRDASGWNVTDKIKTRDVCLLGDSELAIQGCVIGAAKDITYYHHDDDQANAFCDEFKAQRPNLTTACRKIVKSYYDNF